MWLLTQQGYIWVGGKRKPRPEPAPPPLDDPLITISTAGAKTISTKFSVNMVDAFYKGKASNGNARDLQAEPYLSLSQQLGFTNIVYPSYGSAANYTHPPTGGNNDDGYGSNVSDFTGSPDNYYTWHDAVNTVTWGYSFSEASITFAASLGAALDVCFNLKHGSNAEMDYYLNEFNPEFIQLGAELVIKWDKDSYKAAAEAMIAYLDAQGYAGRIVIDTVNVNVTAPTKVAWNAKLATIAGATDGRYYLQCGDRCAFTANQDSNVTKILNLIDVLLPADVTKFKSLFPNWKMFLAQIEIEDAAKVVQYVNNKPVGNWALGKIFEFILEYTEDISYAAWMNLKNLINNLDVPSNNYIALVRNSPLLQMQNRGTITFANMPGVTGKVVFTGSNFFLLVNNRSGNRYEVPTSSISIDGNPAGGTAYRDSGYATTWNAAVQTEQATEATIIIPEYSNSVISL